MLELSVMKRRLIVIAISLFVFAPTFTFAALVPCDGVDVPCQACHFIQLGQRIITWLVEIVTFIVALVFVVGGFQMVTSGGDSSAVSSAREKMTNAIIGFIILLLAWLIIDTVLKMLVDENKLSSLGRPWNEVACVVQPKYEWSPYPDRSRGLGDTSPRTATEVPGAVAEVGTYKEQLCDLAKKAGIEGECASLQALMTVESGGRKDARSPAGACGLMQVMPATAKGMSPSDFSGLSNQTEICNKLRSDTMLNMRLGVAYYKEAYDKYNGDRARIYASYNGGHKANDGSTRCPGQMSWQCELNSGYAETRTYVPWVTACTNFHTTGAGSCSKP